MFSSSFSDEENLQSMNNFKQDINDIRKCIQCSFQKNVVPILILQNKEAKSLNGVLRNGTGFLIRRNDKFLLYTCHHVWEEYCKMKSENSENIICAFFGENSLLNLSNFTPSFDSNGMDIAIFDLSKIFIKNQCKEKAFYIPNSFPHREPQVGDCILALGYPGILRQPNQNNINIIFIIDFIKNISEKDITLRDENNERKVHYYNDNLPKLDNYGGFSGGPAFVQIEDRWIFVGIMYEGVHTLLGKDVGIIKIARINNDL